MCAEGWELKPDGKGILKRRSNNVARRDFEDSPGVQKVMGLKPFEKTFKNLG